MKHYILYTFILTLLSANAQTLNLLKNPGFEQGGGNKVPAWMYKPQVQKVTMHGDIKHSGRNAVLIVNKKLSGSSGLKQRIKFRKPQSGPFLVRAWAKADITGKKNKSGRKGHMFAVRFQCKYADGGRKNEVVREGFFDPNDKNWQHVSFSWNPDKPLKNCDLILSFGYPGKVYFDDVKFINVSDLMPYAEGLKSDADLPGYKFEKLQFDFNNKELPPELISHLGKWKIGNGIAASPASFGNAGAILRTRDMFLPVEVNVELNKKQKNGTFFLVIGNWRIAFFPDHVGVWCLRKPLSLFPLTQPFKFAPGRHDIKIKLSPSHLTVDCDGKQILKFDKNTFKELGEMNPCFVDVKSPIFFQVLETPVDIHKVSIKGLRTGRNDDIKSVAYIDEPRRVITYNNKITHTGPGKKTGRIYTHDVNKKVDWKEKFNDSVNWRYEGKEFTVKLTGLSPGAYTLEMSMWEDEVEKPGKRIFNIYANGQLIFKNIDLFKTAGCNFMELVYQYPFQTNDVSDLVLNFIANSEYPAFVNKITLKKDNRTVWTKICNFKTVGKSKSNNYNTPGNYKGFKSKAKQMMKKEGDWTGVNLIYNGDFEKTAMTDGLPEGWRLPVKYWRKVKGKQRGKIIKGRHILGLKSGNEFWKQGTGSLVIDMSDKHSGKASLRLSKTKGTFGVSKAFVARGNSNIDWTREYEITFWAKAQNASGKNGLRIDWSRMVNHTNPLYQGHSDFPVKNGSYNWTKYTFKVKPPQGAQGASFAVFSQNNTGSVWFDDLYCDGYGSAPVEVKVCDAGYDPLSVKDAVVWNSKTAKNGSFVLWDTKNGKEVFSGSLKLQGFKKELQRNIWIADFSKYRKTGTYKLKVKFAGGTAAESPEFSIKSDFYLDLAALYLEYISVIAAGRNKPGWHGPDYIDDGMLPNYRDPTGGRRKLASQFTLNRRYIPMVGNFYDAGDFSKKPMGLQGTYAMTSLAKNWKRSKDKLDEKFPDPLFYAWWAAKMYVDTQRPDGAYYGGISTKGVLRHYSADPAVLSDGIPGTLDEKYIYENANPPMPFVIAKFAKQIKSIDPEMSKRYAESAAKNLEGVIAYWDNYGGAKAKPWARLIMEPAICWAALYLDQLYPGNKKYNQEWQKRAKSIIKLVNDKTFLDEQYMANNTSTHIGVTLIIDLSFALCLEDIIKFHPDSKIAIEAKKALKKFLDDYLIPSMKTNVFGRVSALDEKPEKPYFSPRYHNSYVYVCAKVLADASVIFDDKNYLDHAEHQIQWALGRNHHGLTFVAGAGKKMTATRTHMAIVKGHEDCIIPGGVVKGFIYGTGQGDTSANGQIPYGFPVSAGVHWKPENGYIPAGQEYYQVLGHYFCMGVEGILNAMEYFRSKQ